LGNWKGVEADGNDTLVGATVEGAGVVIGEVVILLQSAYSSTTYVSTVLIDSG